MKTTRTPKRFVSADGRKYAVWIYRDSIGALTAEFSDRTVALAEKRQDYAYTHGGEAYRAACEKAWELGL